MWHCVADDHGAFSTGSVDESSGNSPLRARTCGRCNTTSPRPISSSTVTAEGEIYSVATHTFAAGDRDVDVMVGGRYLDKSEKCAGRWKFVERMIVTDWATVNDPSRLDVSHPITRGTATGTPDSTGPSHGYFSILRAAT